MTKYFFIALLLTFSPAFSQVYQFPIDTVFWFLPGKGQNLGQDSVYFPQNIFNLPDTNASETIPSSSPKNICSIGLGGEIAVGFKKFFIIDREGPDFTIFENAFINPITKKVFVEPAVVSVSEDGVNFLEFPWNYNTLEGCAGTKPTNGKRNPFDPLVSGGNSFDLSIVGLKQVRFIKIKDICDIILADSDHPFYDPLLSGFDLDCVVGLNLAPISTLIAEESNSALSIVLTNNSIQISSKEILIVEIFDILGKPIERLTNDSNKAVILHENDLRDGFSVMFIKSGYYIKLLKIIKLGNEILLQ